MPLSLPISAATPATSFMAGATPGGPLLFPTSAFTAGTSTITSGSSVAPTSPDLPVQPVQGAHASTPILVVSSILGALALLLSTALYHRRMQRLRQERKTIPFVRRRAKWPGARPDGSGSLMAESRRADPLASNLSSLHPGHGSNEAYGLERAVPIGGDVSRWGRLAHTIGRERTTRVDMFEDEERPSVSSRQGWIRFGEGDEGPIGEWDLQRLAHDAGQPDLREHDVLISRGKDLEQASLLSSTVGMLRDHEDETDQDSEVRSEGRDAFEEDATNSSHCTDPPSAASYSPHLSTRPSSLYGSNFSASSSSPVGHQGSVYSESSESGCASNLNRRNSWWSRINYPRFQALASSNSTSSYPTSIPLDTSRIIRDPTPAPLLADILEADPFLESLVVTSFTASDEHGRLLGDHTVQVSHTRSLSSRTTSTAGGRSFLSERMRGMEVVQRMRDGSGEESILSNEPGHVGEDEVSGQLSEAGIYAVQPTVLHNDGSLEPAADPFSDSASIQVSYPLPSRGVKALVQQIEHRGHRSNTLNSTHSSSTASSPARRSQVVETSLVRKPTLYIANP